MTGTLFERSLSRQLSNRPKVALLFLIWAASGWTLSLFWNDLGDPRQLIAAIPISVVYLMEKQGTFSWFRGMSLPVLAVALSAHLFILTLNAFPQPRVWTIYAALAALIAAFSFLIYRMWTVDVGPRR